MGRIRIAAIFTLLTVAGITAASAQASDAQKLAALAEALKQGVLTQQEYDVKVAQIRGGSIDPKKKQALDDARKAGVLTQQEYDTKLQALKFGATAAPSRPAAGAPSAVRPTASGQKRTVAVADPMFGMPAYTVTIPADWMFEGAMLPGSCGNDLPTIAFRAHSADKLTGVQVMPRVDWFSAADTRAYQMAGLNPCNLHAPAHAADVASAIAISLRPGAQIATTAALPPNLLNPYLKRLEDANGNLKAASASTPGYVTHATGDMQRVRLRYDLEGHPEEEWINLSVTVWDQPVTVINTGRGGIVQPGIARLMHTIIGAAGMRAPAGKLDATEGSLQEILLSIKMVPEYEQAFADFQQKKLQNVLASIRKMGADIRAQGARDFATLQAQNDQFHAWQQQSRETNRQNFERDMQRKDGAAKDFLDYVKDQTYYVNPATGATVTIQDQLGVTGYVTQNSWGNWTQLVPIHH